MIAQNKEKLKRKLETVFEINEKEVDRKKEVGWRKFREELNDVSEGTSEIYNAVLGLIPERTKRFSAEIFNGIDVVTENGLEVKGEADHCENVTDSNVFNVINVLANETNTVEKLDVTNVLVNVANTEPNVLDIEFNTDENNTMKHPPTHKIHFNASKTRDNLVPVLAPIATAAPPETETAEIDKDEVEVAAQEIGNVTSIGKPEKKEEISTLTIINKGEIEEKPTAVVDDEIGDMEELEASDYPDPKSKSKNKTLLKPRDKIKIKIDKINVTDVEVEGMPRKSDDTDKDVTDFKLLGALPKNIRQNSLKQRSFGHGITDDVVRVNPEIDGHCSRKATEVVDSSVKRFDARDIQNITVASPIRAQIVMGSVASKRALFDGLSKKEIDDEHSLKRLRRPCLKPTTPSSGSGKKKRGKKLKKSVVLPSDQSLILDYFRGVEGEAKGS